MTRRRKALRIAVVGGGPAGLYFAELMKRGNPAHRVRVYERNPRSATFGFGVVFSDRALEFLRADDEGLYQQLLPRAESWPDLTVVHRDVRVPIDGNGFAAIGRLELLGLLQSRAEARGVEMFYEHEVPGLAALGEAALGEADLVVGADGANSWLRQAHAAALGATVDERPNRFCWYGTTRAFETLTLTFRTTPDGVFCAHHYRYAPDMSTFLVEVDAATWERSGLARMSEGEAIALCERVFAPDLDGHPIVSNRSLWRAYPLVRCERWSTGNLVLIGDALRTAHFSVGSGTRLAMEDALALSRALDAADGDLPAAFAGFEARRRPPMEKLWRAAHASMEWYERMAEWMPLAPYDFAHAYMTRTGRVSEAQLERTAPRFMARRRGAR